MTIAEAGFVKAPPRIPAARVPGEGEPTWSKEGDELAFLWPYGRYQFPSVGRTAADRKRLVRDFEGLADLSAAEPERLRAFVRLYGPLPLCQHRKPAWLPHAPGEPPCLQWSDRHRLSLYRDYAREFRALRVWLAAMQDFRMRAAVSDRKRDRWAQVLVEHHLETHYQPLVSGHLLTRWREKEGTLPPWKAIGERLAEAVSWWLAAGNFRPVVQWKDGAPELTYIGAGIHADARIWGLLAHQLLADMQRSGLSPCTQSGCTDHFEQRTDAGRPFQFCERHRPRNFRTAERNRRLRGRRRAK